MYRVISLFAFQFIFILTVAGQAISGFRVPVEAGHWIFGKNTQIHFDHGQAIPSITQKPVFISHGVSSISDVNGQLMYFSDGHLVKDSSFNTINNGDSLFGHPLSSQSSLFVAQPGHPDLIYLFTVDLYLPPYYTNGINYSVISTGLVGEPKVISKNNPLLTENAQKISAVLHQNGTDYWIVTHGFGENKGDCFYSFLLTEAELNTTPVTSRVGQIQSGLQNNSFGYMKISPDGSRLALVIPEDGIVEVFDFDTESGMVSNAISSANGQFMRAYGIEFSPDNSCLYFSIVPADEGATIVYQVNLNLQDPFNDPFIVHQFDVGIYGSADSLMGALQLAPDGKIYVAKFKREASTPKNHLGVIYNPDRPGAECNYNFLNHTENNGLYLEGGGSLVGLPNLVSSFLDIPHFYPQGICDKDTTWFSIRNIANIDHSDWNFGDPHGNLVESDSMAPGFIYHEPGAYQVSFTESNGRNQYTYQSTINIFPLPDVQIALQDTIFAEPGSTVVLDAGDWDFYQWQPGGSTQRTLEVTTSGYYSVTVTDSNCCRNTDQVLVRFYTGVANISTFSDKLEVFPNPASSELNIRIKNCESRVLLAIIGMDGQVWVQEDMAGNGSLVVEKKWDISALSAGAYLLRISNEKETYCMKLIKN